MTLSYTCSILLCTSCDVEWMEPLFTYVPSAASSHKIYVWCILLLRLLPAVHITMQFHDSGFPVCGNSIIVTLLIWFKSFPRGNGWLRVIGFPQLPSAVTSILYRPLRSPSVSIMTLRIDWGSTYILSRYRIRLSRIWIPAEFRSAPTTQESS